MYELAKRGQHILSIRNRTGWHESLYVKPGSIYLYQRKQYEGEPPRYRKLKEGRTVFVGLEEYTYRNKQLIQK